MCLFHCDVYMKLEELPVMVPLSHLNLQIRKTVHVFPSLTFSPFNMDYSVLALNLDAFSAFWHVEVSVKNQ